MSLTRGKLVSSIVSEARTDLQDSGAAPRWSDAQVLTYVNDALQVLGQSGIFRRVDVIPATAARGVYQPLCENVTVFGVWYGGQRLEAKNLREMERRLGRTWHEFSGFPVYYVPGPGDSIRIGPLPTNSGAAPTFGTAPISEADGKGPSGHGYWSALNGSTVQHWLPGDGTVSGDLATGNLWIDYAYYPAAVVPTQLLPTRCALACRSYAVARCLEGSEDATELKRAALALQRFVDLADDLATGQTSSEYLPQAGNNQVGWEAYQGGVPSRSQSILYG